MDEYVMLAYAKKKMLKLNREKRIGGINNLYSLQKIIAWHSRKFSVLL